MRETLVPNLQLPFLKAAEDRESFFKRIARIYPCTDERYLLIQRAYDTAKDAFRDVHRDDGGRYFEHLRAVAIILLDHLRVRDHILIVSALLHDLVEDIDSWTVTRVADEFGEEVAKLVDYLSKPPLSEWGSKKEQELVYHERFAAAPKEFFLIKLADRWHNLTTLFVQKRERILRKIEETKLHYLPYAEKHWILIHELEQAIRYLEEHLEEFIEEECQP